MTKDKDPKDTPELHVYDTRLVERNLKRGLISRKDFEKHVRSLPDVKDKVKPTAE